MKDNVEIKLWLLHRITAAILGVSVIFHLVGIIIAIQGGLSSEEILSRTHGNYLLGIFYSIFCISAAIHASIGLRTVFIEVMNWNEFIIKIISCVFFIFLVIVGLSAVGGLVL